MRIRRRKNNLSRRHRVETKSTNKFYQDKSYYQLINLN
jgi:hypothetical protein